MEGTFIIVFNPTHTTIWVYFREKFNRQSLIIDAMDLLYTGKFDGFCIVSSDSDFTRLASRIREAGLIVYGFGERKTPKAFVSACDKFIFTEVLRSKDNGNEKISRKTTSELKQDTKLVNY